MSLAFRAQLGAETKRRILAHRDERGVVSEDGLRAALAEVETANEDELYRAYLTAVGEPLVEVSAEEMAAIEQGLRRGEIVDREIAAEREREQLELAERERRENEEADKLWDAYKTAIGPWAGYE